MAKSIFADYLDRGVIMNCRFEDNVWKLTNQTANVTYTLSFEFGESDAMDWLDCDGVSYLACVKSYIALHLGDLQLSTMQGIVRLFKRLCAMDAEQAASIVGDAYHALALLELLPGGSESRDYVIASLEERCEHHYSRDKNSHQRTLAEFRSYLRFDEILRSFWPTASREQKLFYFPVYFWWNLTAILPLRPIEFLLTPRNCLDGNILTVRRTRLKGGMNQISYNIAGDYECHRYAITDWLSGEILEYLRLTETMQGTGLNTLFRLKPHFAYSGISPSDRNRYYTYSDLRSCLRCFYQEAIDGAGGGVEHINLGDTRHLAMISLIISGGSPTICKELAGHANIDISSHYYSNISTFVECITRERFQKSRCGSAELSGANRYTFNLPPNSHRLGDGYCDAQPVMFGDISECLKVINADGHIGDCAACPHFWPDNPGIWLRIHDSAISKQQVDMDSQYLIRMIELVRKGQGDAEDINAAILKLQHSCGRFSDCLTEKYLSGEGK